METPTEAVEIIATVLTWQEQYDLGMKYLSDGNYEEAIIAFTAAIELEPKNATLYLGRAEAHMNYVDLADSATLAFADYEMAVELDASNPLGYLGLAEVYIAQGDFEAAIAILEQGLTIITDSSALQVRLDELNDGNISDFWGNVRKMSNYDENDILQWYHIYEYDGEKKTLATSYDAVGNQTGQIEVLYDEDGNRIQGYLYISSGEGILGQVGKIISEYDEAGNIVKEMWYDENEEVDMIFVNEYEEDVLQKETRYDANGVKEETTTYSYLEDGTKRADTYCEEDGHQSYTLWEYNEAEYLVKYGGYAMDGHPYWYTVYERDDDGMCISMTSYDGDGTILDVTIYN